MFNKKIALALASTALAIICTSSAMAESLTAPSQVIPVKATSRGPDTFVSSYDAMAKAEEFCSTLGGQKTEPYSTGIYLYRNIYIASVDMSCRLPL